MERKVLFAKIAILVTVLTASFGLIVVFQNVSASQAYAGDSGDEAPHKAGDAVSFELYEKMHIPFIWIPAGKATLGSPKSEKERQADESEHTFGTEGFWLAKYECTQAEWVEVMEANPSNFSAGGEGRNIVKRKSTSRYPVEQVMWNDCQQFLKKINERGEFKKAFGKKGRFVLPQEDQWEYACRGGKGNATPFYWGLALNGAEANCDGTMPYGTDAKGAFLRRTADVGTYAKESPHPWGLCDMNGSVWEWCDNWYDNKNNSRVLRGGSWSTQPSKCRTAYRSFAPPGEALVSDGYGFRLCVSLD